jgi:dynein heavy chain
MPGEWARAKDGQRLLVLRALRPDRVTGALRAYCEKVMGAEYTRQEPFDVKALLCETTAAAPIFFTLFPGYSPSKEVEAAAATEPGGGVKLTTISMGQGQEAPAEAALKRCMRDGGWVFLDNVHLMQAWIPRLERLLEDAAERAHPNFRCFLSAEPIAGAPHAAVIPESILQGAAKVSNEPPSDMASNMRRALAAFGPDVEARLSGAAPGTVAALRSILFGLCFYHSLLLGRKKFGVGIGSGSGSGLGFCRNYSFNAGDLTTCGDVAANYLAAYGGAVPWADLRYMFGEVFYGGHITDAMDRRCCMAYLAMLMRPELLPGGDLYADPATWTVPALELAPGFRAPQRPTSMAALARHIESALPPESPVVYGMHPNAELSTLTLLGESLFRALAEGGAGDAAAAAAAAAANGGGGAGRSGGSGGGAASGPAASAAPAAAPAASSGDAAVRAALKDYAERLPAPFDLIDIDARAKLKTPYVVAALQEAARMNALLGEMRRGLDELQLGLDGALNMSPAMEALAAAMAANAVPAAWMAAMSARVQEVLPLGAWYADVLKRHEQLAAWTAGSVAPPASVWLPGLFNPKAFLTAVMQTHARAAKLPLDEMRFITEVTAKTPDQITAPAPVGAYVHGLTLEGARWDRAEGRLADPLPGELRHAMPVMLVRPVTAEEAAAAAAAGPVYECPVYTNMQRANVYSPCVSTFTLRCAEEPSKWVLASAALLLQDELA